MGDRFEVEKGYKWEEPSTEGYDLPNEPEARKIIRSQVLHETPPFEGEWILVENDLEIKGWVGIWPKEQHIQRNNGEVFYLKECD